MKKIIHNLRKQPEEVRRHVLHMTVAIAAGILFLLWVISLGRTVTNEEVQEDVAKGFSQLVPLEDNTEIPEIW